MEKRAVTKYWVLILFLLAGCSPVIFLSPSQRFEQEADNLLANDRVSEALLAYYQAFQADSSNHAVVKKMIPLYRQQGRLREADFLVNKLTEQEIIDLDGGIHIPQPEGSTGLEFQWLQVPVHDEPIGLDADINFAVIAYRSGQVSLLKLGDGSVVWSQKMGQTISSPPGLSENAVLVGSDTGIITALDRLSGSILWKATVTGAVYASLLVDGSQGYIGSYSRKLTAIDLVSGSIIWQTDVADPVLNQPSLENDILYIGTTGGKVFALDRIIGKPLWDKPALLSGSIEGRPVLADNMLLVGSNDSRLYALALNGRDYFWQYSTSDSLYASPLIQEGHVFVFSIGQTAAALDLITGEPFWKVELPVPVRSTPVVVGSRIYFAGVSQPTLFEIDAKSGQITGQMNTGDWIESGPLITGNTLLLAGKDGAVIAYRLN
jgi:outer membrane protein assembly factor BamB